MAKKKPKGTKDLVLEVIGEVQDILETVADTDGLGDARKEYMDGCRKLWKKVLKPQLKTVEGKQALVDADDVLELIELMVRRFA